MIRITTGCVYLFVFLLVCRLKCCHQFFSSFTTLILSNNYVTKRQSLKLLGEILLDRANFSVMTRYIANEANLKMMMNLLRDKSKNIQFEAFHVFKVRIYKWTFFTYLTNLE